MVRGIANSKIGFGDLILLLRYFFKLKVSTHPSYISYLKLSKIFKLAKSFNVGWLFLSLFERYSKRTI
ncbi:hypothetical protein D9Y31_15370 [Acinetobacter baumannii]|nr:hypothetical protein D9Y31_15370 [Acinetobacter baumannii]TKV57570.1 hypothetical protein D9Y30_14195 [Acinetobacter baumannii]